MYIMDTETMDEDPTLLVGRDVERQILLDAWESVQTINDNGGPITRRVVLISGPSGIGKSRLAQTLCDAKTNNVVTNRFDRLASPLQPFAWKKQSTSIRRGPSMASSTVHHHLSSIRGPRCRRRRVSQMRMSLRGVTTPTVWLVEDLHHADESALQVWTDVIQDKSVGAVLFVATTTCETIPEALQGLKGVVHIQLGPLNLKSVQALVVGSGQDNHDVVQAICKQSGGNPLYALELAASPDLRGCDSLQDLYQNKVTHQVDKQTLELLQIAACFGQTVKRNMLKIVIADDLDKRMEQATSFLVPRNHRVYQFVHECAHEAIYNTIKEPAEMHLMLGRKIWRALSEEELKDNIFVVIHQIWWGRHLLTNQEEKYGIASLCHYAAEEAVRSTHFTLAVDFFNWGMSLLGENHYWRTQYDLSLAIYNGTCELAYLSGDFDRARVCLEAVEQNARTFHDKVTARTTYMSCQTASSSPKEALASGDLYLKEMNVRILPRSGGSTAHLLGAITKLRFVLSSKSNESIMRMPAMTDPDHLAIMQIMNMSMIQSQFVDEKRTVFLAIRMIQMTLKHGLCAFSCVSFSNWATAMCTLRKLDEAARFGDLALRLLEKFETKQWLTRVYTTVYGFIKPWKCTQASVLDALYYSYRCGLEQGDVEFAIICATFHTHHSFNAGCPLATIEKTALELRDETSSRERTMMNGKILPFLQLIQSLQGKTENPKIIDRDVIPERAAISILEAENNGGKLMRCWANGDQMMLAYLLGDSELATRAGDVARQIFSLYLPGLDVYHVALFDGLVSLERYQLGDRKRLHLSNARKQLKRLKTVGYLAPQNVLGKYYLLHAQLLATIKKNRKKMTARFLACIALFDKSGMSLERGLSNYVFGKLLDSDGDRGGARAHYLRAASIYEEWGAVALVSHLAQAHPQDFPQGHSALFASS